MADKEIRIGCGRARRSFIPLLDGVAASAEADSARRHLELCARCASEYRIAALSRATLDAAAASEPVGPDGAFFNALRARIARGPDERSGEAADESWAAALLLTARQLIPVMAVLLLLIIGATLIWNRPNVRESAQRADAYELPEPAPDDNLDSIVALEDRRNGR